MFNVERNQLLDLRGRISEHLKHVPAGGDGLYGTITTPFDTFINNYYNPTAFRNRYDYSFALVNDAYKRANTKPYATQLAVAQNPDVMNIVGDLCSNLYNFTNDRDLISFNRELYRMSYIQMFPNNADGSVTEMDIATINQANPNFLIGLLARMGSIQTSLQDKELLKPMINEDLIRMLGILKANDAKAYALALKLCNITESYFALATSVSNMAKAALTIAPQQPTAAVGPTVAVGNVQAAQVATAPQTLSVGDMINRYINEISIFAHLPIYSALISGATRLPETALDNIHLMLAEDALGNPNTVFKLTVDDKLVYATKLAANTNVLPYKTGVIIAYALGFMGYSNLSELLSQCGFVLADYADFNLRNAMSFDIHHNTIINTALFALNKNNGTVGQVVYNYIIHVLAKGQAIKIQDVLAYTSTYMSNPGTSVTVQNVANYMQTAFPTIFGPASGEALMVLADAILHLGY